MALLAEAILKQKCFLGKSLILSFLQFKLSSVFFEYLRQMKSKSLIQGHFYKLEIKSYHLTPRFMGFYSVFLEILAPKERKKAARFALVACIL